MSSINKRLQRNAVEYMSCTPDNYLETWEKFLVYADYDGARQHTQRIKDVRRQFSSYLTGDQWAAFLNDVSIES